MQVLRSTIVVVCAACVFVACGGDSPTGNNDAEAPARFLPVLRSAPISRRSQTVAGVRRGTVTGLRIPEP